MKTKSYIYCYLIVIGIFIILISNSLFTEGMSSEGLRNGVIAQRMTVDNHGYANFWSPWVCSGSDNDLTFEYAYHMPLGYWIESSFMRLFGDSYLFDKIYSVLIFVVIAVLIMRLWVLTGNTIRTGWIPLAFWLMAPLTSWSATSNLVEGPQTIFVLLAVICLMHSHCIRKAVKKQQAVSAVDAVVLRKRQVQRWFWVVAAALMMEIAFLIKGFSGLYVLVMPLLFYPIEQNDSVRAKPRYRLSLASILEVLAIIVVWFLTVTLIGSLSPSFWEAVRAYLDHLVQSMRDEQSVVSRFYILWSLARQMWLPLLILAGVSLVHSKQHYLRNYLLYWRYRGEMSAEDVRNAYYAYRFMLLALCGVLPIMLTLKQHNYYLVTTLPLFSIAFALFVANVVQQWEERLNRRAASVLLSVSVIVIVAGVLVNLNSMKQVQQDADMIVDLHNILPILSEDEVVSVTPELMGNSQLANYFYRYKRILFDTSSTHEHLLSMQTDVGAMGLYGTYTQVFVNTKRYHLYALGDTSAETLAVGEGAASCGADKEDPTADSLQPNDPIRHAIQFSAQHRYEY